MRTTTKAGGGAKMKQPAGRPHEPWLRERLAADAQEARLYLEAALEDEEPRVFLVALKHVVDAYGSLGKLAKATGLNRENPYQMLSEKGNPEVMSLSRALQTFGLRLTVEPVTHSRVRAVRMRPRRPSRRGSGKPVVGSRR